MGNVQGNKRTRSAGADPSSRPVAQRTHEAPQLTIHLPPEQARWPGEPLSLAALGPDAYPQAVLQYLEEDSWRLALTSRGALHLAILNIDRSSPLLARWLGFARWRIQQVRNMVAVRFDPRLPILCCASELMKLATAFDSSRTDWHEIQRAVVIAAHPPALAAEGEALRQARAQEIATMADELRAAPSEELLEGLFPSLAAEGAHAEALEMLAWRDDLIAGEPDDDWELRCERAKLMADMSDTAAKSDAAVAMADSAVRMAIDTGHRGPWLREPLSTLALALLARALQAESAQEAKPLLVRALDLATRVPGSDRALPVAAMIQFALGHPSDARAALEFWLMRVRPTAEANADGLRAAAFIGHAQVQSYLLVNRAFEVDRAAWIAVARSRLLSGRRGFNAVSLQGFLARYGLSDEQRGRTLDTARLPARPVVVHAAEHAALEAPEVHRTIEELLDSMQMPALPEHWHAGLLPRSAPPH